MCRGKGRGRARARARGRARCARHPSRSRSPSPRGGRASLGEKKLARNVHRKLVAGRARGRAPTDRDEIESRIYAVSVWLSAGVPVVPSRSRASSGTVGRSRVIMFVSPPIRRSIRTRHARLMTNEVGLPRASPKRCAQPHDGARSLSKSPGTVGEHKPRADPSIAGRCVRAHRSRDSVCVTSAGRRNQEA